MLGYKTNVIPLMVVGVGVSVLHPFVIVRNGKQFWYYCPIRLKLWNFVLWRLVVGCVYLIICLQIQICL